MRVGAGRSVGWRFRSVASVVVLFLVASLLGAAPASSQDDTKAFAGKVTEFEGSPVADTTVVDADGGGFPVNEVNLTLGSLPDPNKASLSGQLSFNVQAVVFDEDNNRSGVACIRIEMALDNTELTITGASADAFFYAATVTVNSFTSSESCATGGGEPITEQVQLEMTQDLTASPARLTGSMTFPSDSLKFEAARVGDTGFSSFLEGITLGSDVINEVRAASSCPDNLGVPLPAECDVPRALAASFQSAFSGDFKDKSILKDLAAVVLLRSMEKPDGTRLLPTLNRLLKVILLLAIKADNGDDGTARSAMNRLVAIAVALDVEATK